MTDDLDNVFDDDDLGLDPVEVPAGTGDGDEIVIEDDDIFSEEKIEKEIIESNVLDDFLKSKGITDSTIKILGEDDKEEEVNFYELSKEDQLEILNSFSEAEPESTIGENEEKFLEHLKANELGIEDYLKQYKDKIIEEVNSQVDPSHEIDAYDDQELFLLDLKGKFDLTDEELISELEKELLNEELFKKKVDALRTEYKELEDQYKETEKVNSEKERQEEYDTFTETMVDVAHKTPEFYGIELEDGDKNEVLSYLLELDDNGTSSFYKDLNSPEKLYEAAWFLKYGKQAFDAVQDAYETEIKNLTKKDKKPVVIKKGNNDKNDISNIF